MLNDCFKMFVDCTVVPCRTTQASWINVLLVLFYVGLLGRICFASCEYYAAANICLNNLVYNSNQTHKSQSLFNLIIALHVSGVTITHLQKHKTTASTASGNHYTVIHRVKFTDKEYRQTRLKLQLLNNVYSAKNAISSIE